MAKPWRSRSSLTTDSLGSPLAVCDLAERIVLSSMLFDEFTLARGQCKLALEREDDSLAAPLPVCPLVELFTRNAELHAWPFC